MRTTSTTGGGIAVVGLLVMPVVLATWLVLGTSVFAQQSAGEVACPSQLKEAEYKLNAETLQLRTLRDAFARELRVAVERAEKAEQALAQAKAAATDGAKLPVAKPQE
jgi:hypothetical protein